MKGFSRRKPLLSMLFKAHNKVKAQPRGGGGGVTPIGGLVYMCI